MLTGNVLFLQAYKRKKRKHLNNEPKSILTELLVTELLSYKMNLKFNYPCIF